MKLYKLLSSILFFALLFNRCLFAADDNHYDIAIVGAGLSGLNAARIIHEAQPALRLAVIEGRDRLGGRAHTYLTPDGKLIEAGGEMISADHDYALKLLEELGLGKDPIAFNAAIFGISGNEKIGLKELLTYLDSIISMLEQAQEKSKDQGYMELDVKSNQMVFSKLYPYLNFENENAKAFLECIIRDEYGIDLDMAPLSSLAGWIEILEGYQELLEVKATLEIDGVADPEASKNHHHEYPLKGYRIKGGTKALAEGLASKLPAGFIFTSTCLTNLSKKDNRYTLTTKDGRIFSADKVIVSAPFSTLRSTSNILDDASLGISAELRMVINTMAYGTNSKFIVPLPNLPPTNYVLNLNYGGITAWDNPAGITWMLGGKAGAEIQDDSAITSGILSQMEALMGYKSSDNNQPIVFNWSQDPFSLGSYRANAAGQPISELYEENTVLPGLFKFATPLNDNTLFFIGEHTCNGNPVPSGYMESALFSGYVVGEFISNLTQPTLKE
jgi:monoamine oxidase